MVTSFRKEPDGNAPETGSGAIGGLSRRPGVNDCLSTMRKLWCLFLAVAALQVAAGLTLADGREAGRLTLGLKLFRATLASDLAIADKVAPDGRLHLLVFGDDPTQARRFADRLVSSGPIRDIPLQATVSDDPALTGFRNRPPAAIFIAQPALSYALLQRLVAFGRTHHVIVYSPFEGHVEQGVMAGLFITAKVQPYVNRRALEASGIRMKAIFLKVAKQLR